jgi:hypothetical protein
VSSKAVAAACSTLLLFLCAGRSSETHQSAGGWNAEHFKADRFVADSSNGNVTLNFKGQVPLGPIPIEHAQ